ncbi:MAG: hypothetical protein LBC19_11275 [Tannerella sp.]|nr:hypothetical protein [Tannerella sp.]
MRKKIYGKKFVSAFTSAFIEERIYDYDRRSSNGEINIAKTVKRALSKNRNTCGIFELGK